MCVTNCCKDYFSGFKKASSCCTNDAKTNVLTLLMILSYFTIIIPVCVYVASLCGRICKKQNLSPADQQVNALANNILPPAPLTIPVATVQQSMKLLVNAKAHFKNSDSSSWDADNLEKLTKIVQSEAFLSDPVFYMVHRMIERGVGRAMSGDDVTRFMISQMPDFAKQVGSIEGLEAIAQKLYKNEKNKEKMLETFKAALKKQEIKGFLKETIDKLNESIKEGNHHLLSETEGDFRTFFDIFHQARNLKDCSLPRFIPE